VPVITQKTSMVKKHETSPDWLVLDVDGMIVGRIATQIATVLMGKHKASYTPHVDCGDVVIVLNAHRIRFSGNEGRHPTHPYYTSKMEFRTYETYSGYPSGRKVKTAAKLLESKPEKILYEAVRRMLPKSKLGRHMLQKLRLVCGTEHEHQAQMPKPFPEHLLPKS
jgi:large subunit ribosomal protein L13